MIDKLTKKQIALMPKYVEKWLEVGLSTEKLKQDECQKSSDYLFEVILGKKKQPIIIFESPLSAWIGLHLFLKEFSQSVRQGVEQSVGQSVRQSVWQSVRQSVGQSVWQSVEQSVWQSVGQSVRQSVRQSVGQTKLLSFIYPYIDGQFMSGYLSFYDFMNVVLNVKYSEHWEWYKNTSKHSLMYPLDNICIFSEKPEFIGMKNGRIHCESREAIKYRDGYGIWALNGIVVPENIVMTSSEKLNPELALNEKNVDIQREIIRKIGYERILYKMGAKSVDDWTDPKTGLEYHLKEMKLATGINRKYLCYEHASLKGVNYAQPVPPEIRKAAIARGYMLNMLSNQEARINWTDDKESMVQKEIEANLPQVVS